MIVLVMSGGLTLPEVTEAELAQIREAAGEGERVRLRRRPGPHGAWLPEELLVDRAALESGDPALAARFILLDLPERYAR